MSFLGDLITQSIVPQRDIGQVAPSAKNMAVHKKNTRGTTKLPTRSTKPQTKPLPLKRVKKEPAPRTTIGMTNNPVQKEMQRTRPGMTTNPVQKKMQKGVQTCRVKREPISQGADINVLKAPSCEREGMVQMCIPGGVAPRGEDASLNVQQAQSCYDAVPQDHLNFLMVPTQSTDGDVGQQKVVVRGRKPKIQIACNDGKCGQCRRCRCRAYWDKLGATHAMEVMSVYGGKQCVWAAWKDEGVGCLLCFNFQIALDKRVGKPTQARCRVAQCPWAHFKMLILKKSALLRHEQAPRHPNAVAFHATGSVVSILPLVTKTRK